MHDLPKIALITSEPNETAPFVIKRQAFPAIKQRLVFLRSLSSNKMALITSDPLKQRLLCSSAVPCAIAIAVPTLMGWAGGETHATAFPAIDTAFRREDAASAVRCAASSLRRRCVCPLHFAARRHCLSLVCCRCLSPLTPCLSLRCCREAAPARQEGLLQPGQGECR